MKTQLEFNFDKPRDATPKEVEDWFEQELKPWGDRQSKVIIIACLVQAGALGFMFSMFALIQHYVNSA